MICLALTDSRAYGRITALDVTWVSDDRRGVYTDSDIAAATSGSHVIPPSGALRERTHTCFLLAKTHNRRLFRSYVVFQLDRGGVLPLLKPPQSVRLALLVVIMILSRPCGGLGPACIAHDNTTGDSDKNHRGPRNGWFLCFTLPFLLFFPTQCDSKAAEPDLLHERSYRTCFEPDNPRRRTAAPVPTHPHLHGYQEGIINPATSTFRLVLGGATLLLDEDPGGRPAQLDLVVL